MAHSHSDNKSGETAAERTEKDFQTQLTKWQEEHPLDPYQREINRRFEDLPAAQTAEGNINFLGSSYSGADIKVIAHLYDSTNLADERLEKLNHQLAVANAVVEGCVSVLNNLTMLAQESTGLDYNTRRDAFFATALGQSNDEAAQEAKTILEHQVLSGNNFSFMGLAKVKQNIQILLEEQKRLITELENKIQHVKDVKIIESSSTVVLGTLQTISVQSFREKTAVRALGHAYAKGYTRGTRTIGGSCIFTIFDEHALSHLIRSMGASVTYGGERDSDLSTLLADQLPPIDLTIVFANEYGALSDMRLYGVEFFTDGTVFSIEDLLSEEVMNFVCRDADIMTKRGRIRISRLQRGMFNDSDDKDTSGSSLLFDNQAYYDYLDKLGVRRRLTNR